MYWQTLNFGKHQGLSLPQVLFRDPDWFFYAVNQEYFEKRYQFHQEVGLLTHRARNIKPHSDYVLNLRVEYLFNCTTAKFAGIRLADSEKSKGAYYSSLLDDGFQVIHTSDVIDLSYPAEWGTYGKGAHRILIRDLKACLFGTASARIGKRRAESFFSDGENFAPMANVEAQLQTTALHEATTTPLSQFFA